jgi:hypothetical protein
MNSPGLLTFIAARRAPAQNDNTLLQAGQRTGLLLEARARRTQQRSSASLYRVAPMKG